MPKAYPLLPCEVAEPWLLRLAPWQRRVIAWTCITFVSSLFFLIPLSYLCIPLLAYCGAPASAAMLAAVLISLSFVPVTEWVAARRFCQVLYDIFPVRHNVSPQRAAEFVHRWKVKDERFILGMHPHGVVPIQAFLWAAYCDQYMRTDEYGTVYGFGGMASVIFRFPVLRTIMGWLSGVAATYTSLKSGMTGAVFARPPVGHNLYMLPGGLAEIFTAKPGTHTAVWKPRRGLCRLALETGARLIPMYVFGGNDFFHQAATGDSTIARLSRKFGASVTFFWGWCFLPVPLVPPHGVSIVIGDPLPSRRAAGEKPTDAEIDALHKAYADELNAAFDAHKAAAGYPDATLKII